MYFPSGSLGHGYPLALARSIVVSPSGSGSGRSGSSPHRFSHPLNGWFEVGHLHALLPSPDCRTERTGAHDPTVDLGFSSESPPLGGGKATWFFLPSSQAHRARRAPGDYGGMGEHGLTGRAAREESHETSDTQAPPGLQAACRASGRGVSGGHGVREGARRGPGTNSNTNQPPRARESKSAKTRPRRGCMRSPSEWPRSTAPTSELGAAPRAASRPRPTADNPAVGERG